MFNIMLISILSILILVFIYDIFQKNNKTVIDTLNWKSIAKKSGFQMGDYINEFKIENQNRPNKNIIYPIALFILIIFGYFNKKRRQ